MFSPHISLHGTSSSFKWNDVVSIATAAELYHFGPRCLSSACVDNSASCSIWLSSTHITSTFQRFSLQLLICKVTAVTSSSCHRCNVCISSTGWKLNSPLKSAWWPLTASWRHSCHRSAQTLLWTLEFSRCVFGALFWLDFLKMLLLKLQLLSIFISLTPSALCHILSSSSHTQLFVTYSVTNYSFLTG